MRRAKQRRTTTIKIVSVAVTWSDEADTSETASARSALPILEPGALPVEQVIPQVHSIAIRETSEPFVESA